MYACVRAFVCVRACVRVCVRECVRECMRECVRECVHECVRVCVRVCVLALPLVMPGCRLFPPRTGNMTLLGVKPLLSTLETISLCLSGETQKALGPFYVVSMLGK